MAIQVVPSQNVATKFSVGALEDASTDLYVADALLFAVDNFLDEICEFTKPGGGLLENEHVFANGQRAQTVLGELRDKIQEAKVGVDTQVTAAMRQGLDRASN